MFTHHSDGSEVQRRRVPGLSYANVTATVALLVATSGGAYAVASIPPNSVGTAQLQDNAVTTPKIANGAVTRAKIGGGAVNGLRVADDSLTGADIDESTLDLPGGAVTLSGLDFHPRDSTVTNGYAGAGGIYQSSAANGFFAAPLELPQGAVIRAVTVYVVDDDATNDVVGVLTRFDPSTPGAEDLRFANTSGAKGFQPLGLPGDPVTVDNTTSAYRLQVRLGGQGSSTVLQGAKVSYSMPR